jgi:hypothetical protein
VDGRLRVVSPRERAVRELLELVGDEAEALQHADVVGPPSSRGDEVLEGAVALASEPPVRDPLVGGREVLVDAPRLPPDDREMAPERRQREGGETRGGEPHAPPPRRDAALTLDGLGDAAQVDHVRSQRHVDRLLAGDPRPDGGEGLPRYRRSGGSVARARHHRCSESVTSMRSTVDPTDTSARQVAYRGWRMHTR